MAKKNLQALTSNNSGCYITTAVCRSLGKADNCAELQTFRRFRDEWLAFQPGGERLINEYYETAPMIVARIDDLNNSAEIYSNIWNEYLSGCFKHLLNGEYNECKQLYCRMVKDLETKYI